MCMYHRSLADTNSDGKMDKNEFAIAMKLVKMKLKGFDVPRSLPDSLKAVAKSVMGAYLPLGTAAIPSVGMSNYTFSIMYFLLNNY